MKNYISLAFIFLSAFTFGQGIKFEENPAFSTLLEKAKKEKKLIFIDAFAAWCGPCKMMVKNVFPQKLVGDFYNKNFINVAIDMEKGEGRTIAQKYAVTSYPTYLFINGNGELVQKDLGYMDEKAFISLGEESLKTQKFGSLKDRFEKGEQDQLFLEKVIQQYYQSDFELAKRASEKYFAQKKDALKKEEIGYLFGFIKSTEDPNYPIIAQRKNEILQFVTENQLNEFLKPIQINSVLQKSYKENKEIDEAYFLEKASPIIGNIEAKKALNHLKMGIALDKKDYSTFEKESLELYQHPEEISTQELSAAAIIFADHIQNKESLKTAQIWAEKSVMSSETAENTYALAKLLYLNGKKEDAKSFAKLSKILAEKTNASTILVDELIEKIGK